MGFLVSDRESDQLRTCLDLLANRLQRYRGRAIGEQNTKASLIEPLFEALGWDTRDFDEVHREFKAKRADRPVDYALQLLAKPRVFVEAKGLGENLSDRKWVGQILGYATVAGVTWCVLTDGDEYRFYNATASVDADEKLFCQIRISDNNGDHLAKTLAMMSRTNIESGRLSGYWELHFVDRRVREALQGLVEKPDPGLLRLVRRQFADLTPKQISGSFRRLAIEIQPRTVTPREIEPNLGNGEPPKTQRGANVRKAGKVRRQDFGVTLEQIIKAGQLPTPLKLFRKYKGKVLQGVLNADGSVQFDGERFSTCSRAAEQARSTITGRRMNTNGWAFWQYTDADGMKQELTHARDRFLMGERKT